MAGPVYRLRSVLQGHSMDVKHVSAVEEPSGALLTASRDQTARLWYQHQDNTHSLRKVYKGHSKYVSVAVYQEPSEEFPSGLILTGCQDGKIRAFLPDIEDPLYQLDGHAENVTSLFVGKFGTLVSGSWDCTAKVWVSRKCSLTLTGHSFAVWAVAILPEVGLMITASADKLIKLWKAGLCTHTLSGHTDAVRALAVISSEQFLSASNDATVKRWSRTGDCLSTHYGHTNYIYSIALLAPETWVTGGEDRTVRVWQDGEVQQTLHLPAISVWSVAALQDGDIAAATSDGCVRLFSADPARQADQEMQKLYEEEVAKLGVAAEQELGGVKVSDLPGPEALYEPGARDGQQKMVREGDKVTLHSWSTADGKWTKVGDVVGGAGGSTEDSGKKLYMGKEYDYVFDIQLDEPKCTLKLPYNKEDSPYMAAQQFIHKHDLSQFYLDEIASHIVKNTGGSLGASSGGNSDPLTGGSSYSSGALQGGEAQGGGGGMAVDPFTGGGAYTSGSGGVDTGRAAPPPDPWMQGAYRTDEGGEKMDTSSSKPENTYFPQTEFLKFDGPVKVEAVVGKLKEFNSLVPADLKLEEDQLEAVVGLVGADQPQPVLIPALLTLLRWPAPQAFPGLDLVRAALLSPASQPLLLDKEVLDKIFSACLGHLSREYPVPCQMLSLRALCNLFSSQQGRELLATYRDSVVSRVFEQMFPIEGNNKNIQTGAATLLLNFAVSVHKKFDEETQVQLLSALSITFLQPSFITDWEARFRTLVAIGTLLSTSEEAVEYARTLDTKDGVRGYRLLEGPAKVSQCAQLIEDLI